MPILPSGCFMSFREIENTIRTTRAIFKPVYDEAISELKCSAHLPVMSQLYAKRADAFKTHLDRADELEAFLMEQHNADIEASTISPKAA